MTGFESWNRLGHQLIPSNVNSQALTRLISVLKDTTEIRIWKHSLALVELDFIDVARWGREKWVIYMGNKIYEIEYVFSPDKEIIQIINCTDWLQDLKGKTFFNESCISKLLPTKFNDIITMESLRKIVREEWISNFLEAIPESMRTQITRKKDLQLVWETSERMYNFWWKEKRDSKESPIQIWISAPYPKWSKYKFSGWYHQVLLIKS